MASETNAGSRRFISAINELEDVDAFVELARANRWGDGLPLVPATIDRVAATLDATVRASDEVVAVLPPRWADATVEAIAINSVMAGCRPQHLPIILTAVEAVADPDFNLLAVQATTHPCGVMVLVNGPAADRAGVHSGAGLFGPGFEANAAIGRAMRLVLQNIGGAYPGETDLATHGSPAKFTFCFAENESENPWEPMHVEMGFDINDSTVTVAAAEAPHNINDHASEEPIGILLTMAQTIATMGKNNAYTQSDYFVILGPEHAALIARHGWTKRDVQEYLFFRARIPYPDWSRGGMFGILPQPKYISAGDSAISVPMSRHADDIRVVVAGGPGRHSLWIPTFGLGRSVIRKIA